MIKEFKDFALKGNVIDLAVGVIIAGAFGKIISSMVNDIFMPVIGIILGGINFTDLKYVISPATADKAEAAIYYGSFIQSVVNFLIIAFALFIFVKMLATIKKNEALAHFAPPAPPAPAAPPPPSNEEKLLGEIRDLLKQKQ
jgi:large conductance mechanosensitive channel